MSNFIVVSNRLPVNVTRQDGKLAFHVSSGGLATAMSSLNVDNQLWVGWPGIASDDLTSAEKSQITRELRKRGYMPVFLTKQEIADLYEGYANDTLWPLFHYFPSVAKYRSQYWKAYQAVNQKFVRAIKSVADEAATVWIQDYQLMLLPGSVRTVLPRANIGFFLHIPFPSYEIFRLLPERKAIIEGLLGADLIGFHIYDYARHFISSCNHILGTSSEQGVLEYNSRRIKVDAFPIGIDYDKFRKTLSSAGTRTEIARLDERYGEQRLILSVDRLDYSKGIMKRLEAYELLLAEHPELRQTVTLMVVAVPSRTEVETYKQLRDEIEIAISRINGLYGTTDWAPISYQFQNLDFEQLVALYARAEVALVTPLRDGMNLVAKEYIASKRNRKGVLILSEMAGAADEMNDALLVNPNDIPTLASAIYRALTMPKAEQIRRQKSLQARLSDYTVQKWGADYIEQLRLATKLQHDTYPLLMTQAQTDALIKSFITSRKRLLLLDYDGTLHQFTTSIQASAAKPSPKLKAQLKHISEQSNTTVCIISGRQRSMLDAWFRDAPNILLVAEHGAWIKRDGEWKQNAKPFDKSAALDLLRTYETRTAGAIVEEKDFALVWHYRRVNPELAYVRNNTIRHDLANIVRDTDLVVHNGNKIIELKPRSVEKGTVAATLAAESGADFIFCAGDDYTDESMFASLPPTAHTVKVGSGQTKAQHQVEKLEKILDLITAMSKIIR